MAALNSCRYQSGKNQEIVFSQQKQNLSGLGANAPWTARCRAANIMFDKSLSSLGGRSEGMAFWVNNPIF